MLNLTCLAKHLEVYVILALVWYSDLLMIWQHCFVEVCFEVTNHYTQFLFIYCFCSVIPWNENNWGWARCGRWIVWNLCFDNFPPVENGGIQPLPRLVRTHMDWAVPQALAARYQDTWEDPYEPHQPGLIPGPLDREQGRPGRQLGHPGTPVGMTMTGCGVGPAVVGLESQTPTAPWGQTDSSGLGWNRALDHGTGVWEPQGSWIGLLRAIVALSALTFNDLYVKHKRSVCLCQKEWLHASWSSGLMTFLFTLLPQR